ncbi:MAG: HepT-like ribonuclease domain-containing protein [Candidatus Methylomirabilales bacterium]
MHSEIFSRLAAQAPSLLAETPVRFAYGFPAAYGFALLRGLHLAVFVDPALPADAYFHVEIRLEAILEETFGLPVADVRILNGSALTFRGAVVAAGRLVFCRDGTERIRFEATTRSQYLDLKPWLDFQRAALEEEGPETMRTYQETIEAARGHLGSALEQLKGLGAIDSDPVKEAAARYFLLVAVAAALEISQHIIAMWKLRPPRDLIDVAEVLREVGLYDGHVAARFADLIALRNALVHTPVMVESQAFAKGLPERLAHLEEVRKILARPLQDRPPDADA